MSLVRILVDGYSLLHCWTDLARGKPRFSAAAREELIFALTQYQDAIGTPITVFFDGAGGPAGRPKVVSRPEMEVLFSRAGQTADDLIERAAYRFCAYGEVLVVTDDFAERDTIHSVGGMVSSCANFIRTIEGTLDEMRRRLGHHNRREISEFKKRTSA